MDAKICTHTGTRREACACGFCALRSPPAPPADKHQANKRDVLALLDLLAVHVESQQSAVATWGDVGDVAHLRARLVELVVAATLPPDGDERAARRRIEEALCTEDMDEALCAL